jgi:hypothetical protein
MPAEISSCFTTHRESLKQSVTGTLREATPSTPIVRTLVMARAITLCSGEAIFKTIIL